MAENRERFLIVTFVDIEISLEAIKPLLDTALDWLRIAPNSWILWTSSDPSVWMQYFRSYLGENGGVLIAELNLSQVSVNYTGFLTKSMWTWIDKHRTTS
jgi:hypothetical protein